MQLVVCGLRRSVELERSKQDFVGTRQHEPPRCKSETSRRGTAWSLRQLDQRAFTHGKPTERRDSSVMMVVQGVQEKSQLRTMDALRKFIMVDNHAAEKMVTQKGTWSRGKWRKRKFTTDFLEAGVREGAVELTLRADEKGTLRTFIDTTNVGEKRLTALEVRQLRRQRCLRVNPQLQRLEIVAPHGTQWASIEK